MENRRKEFLGSVVGFSISLIFIFSTGLLAETDFIGRLELVGGQLRYDHFDTTHSSIFPELLRPPCNALIKSFTERSATISASNPITNSCFDTNRSIQTALGKIQCSPYRLAKRHGSLKIAANGKRGGTDADNQVLRLRQTTGVTRASYYDSLLLVENIRSA